MKTRKARVNEMGTKNKPGTYDCYANAHPDEPMFILLGRDPTASDLVERWASQRERERGPSAKVEEARACAKAMREWVTNGGPRDLTIVVNGVECTIPPQTKTLSYEDVVFLAEMTGTPSVMWRVSKASGGLASGTMHPGSFNIAPSDGLVFNVAHTGNA